MGLANAGYCGVGRDEVFCIVSLIVSGRASGVILLAAAAALAGAAACNLASAVRFRGNRALLNDLLVLIAIAWGVAGAATLL